MEIVVFVAADLPNNTLPSQQPGQMLAERQATWSGKVTETATGLARPVYTYDVQGTWKGAAEQNVVIALRYTVNERKVVIYPNEWQLPLRQSQPTTSHALVFSRPAPQSP
jgi:hypothetical protein